MTNRQEWAVAVLVVACSLLVGWFIGSILRGDPEPVDPEPAKVEAVPILDYVNALEGDENQTWFAVSSLEWKNENDEASILYAMVEAFFIVETRFQPDSDPVTLLRGATVTVRLHPGIVTGTQPVPYRKKDLWKIHVTILKTQLGGQYEFIQEGWGDFDPSRDLM